MWYKIVGGIHIYVFVWCKAVLFMQGIHRLSLYLFDSYRTSVVIRIFILVIFPFCFHPAESEPMDYSVLGNRCWFAELKSFHLLQYRVGPIFVIAVACYCKAVLDPVSCDLTHWDYPWSPRIPLCVHTTSSNLILRRWLICLSLWLDLPGLSPYY